jgi:hypothetical protein
MGKGCTDPRIIDVDFSWRRLVSFTHRPLYLDWKTFSLSFYPWGMRLDGSQNRSGWYGEEKNLTPIGIRTPPLGYTDFIVPFFSSANNWSRNFLWSDWDCVENERKIYRGFTQRQNIYIDRQIARWSHKPPFSFIIMESKLETDPKTHAQVSLNIRIRAKFQLSGFSRVKAMALTLEPSHPPPTQYFIYTIYREPLKITSKYISAF